MGGCFKGTLGHLAQNNYWRENFNDQLSIAFKHHLADRTVADNDKYTTAEGVIDGFVQSELSELVTAKVQREKDIKLKAE